MGTSVIHRTMMFPSNGRPRSMNRGPIKNPKLGWIEDERAWEIFATPRSISFYVSEAAKISRRVCVGIVKASIGSRAVRRTTDAATRNARASTCIDSEWPTQGFDLVCLCPASKQFDDFRFWSINQGVGLRSCPAPSIDQFLFCRVGKRGMYPAQILQFISVISWVRGGGRIGAAPAVCSQAIVGLRAIDR